MPPPDPHRERERPPIPVTVVTGFLGAGKTTLVNRWLADAPGEIAVVVNEHGDVGIDGELLRLARVQSLVEISGGCVCCRTQAELMRALEELATSSTPPKRILVETSGAASPAGVVIPISRGGRLGAFALDGVLTVADATRVSKLALDHDLAVEQLAYADVVVLSRADACEPTELARTVAAIASWNGVALVAHAARGELVSPVGASLDQLLDQRRVDFASSPSSSPSITSAPRASHVYESVSLTIDGSVDGDRFADFIETQVAPVASRIFRTKGILALPDVEERMIVQGVGDAVEITFGAAWSDAPRRSRLVVVGFALDRAALSAGFAACAASPSAASAADP